MHALMLCLAATALGIDYGWERRTEGGTEYIIQLDPQTLEAMRAGQPVGSDVRPEAGEVRSFRIVVGTKQLRRDVPVSSSPAPRKLPADPDARPANYEQQHDTGTVGKANTTTDVQPEQPGKPWLPLTFTLLGLFASLGTNAYLGWIAWDFRRRCVTARSAA